MLRPSALPLPGLARSFQVGEDPQGDLAGVYAVVPVVFHEVFKVRQR
jgi:hypothetical protein